MKSCLFVLRTARTAGAERVCLEVFRELRSQFEIDIAVVKDKRRSWVDDVKPLGIGSILFGKYDLIHSHLFLPGLLVRLRRLYDKRFVWVHSVHYCEYNGQTWRSVKRLLDSKFIFPEPDHLVAVSSAVAKFLSPYPKSCLLQNGADLEERETPGRPIDLEAPVLGTASMLREEKGIEDLIALMPKVLDKYPRAVLRVAGDGPRRRKIEHLVSSLKLERSVQILGYVSEMDTFLREVDIYVCFSHSESFGYSILEAMQYSLPIIASNVGEVKNVLAEGKFGLLVKRNETDFLRALTDVLANTSFWQERSHQGLKTNHERFGMKAMLKSHEALYRKAIKTGVCMISPIVTQWTGGLQKQLKLQSLELQKLGHRVFILQRRDPEFAAKAAEWTHVEMLVTPNPFPYFALNSRVVNRMRGALFFVFAVLHIVRRRNEISVLHAHQLYSPTTVGVVARIFCKVGLVVKCTASGLLGEFAELKRLPLLKWRKKAFRWIDRVIVLSEEMKEEMIELGLPEEKLRLIPNSVKVPEQYRTKLPFSYQTGDVMNILYCGRLSIEKSIETLLLAATKMTLQGLPCVVHLVGGNFGGRDVSGHLEGIARANPELKVIFHGHQNNVSPFYLSADVFVLPSASEGMSNALLEALSYGLPCVASDIVPNKAIISDEVNGLLFRQGDVSSLAGKLERLARDQKSDGALSLRLGTEARNTVQAHFSTESICLKLQNLYSEVDRSGKFAAAN